VAPVGTDHPPAVSLSVASPQAGCRAGGGGYPPLFSGPSHIRLSGLSQWCTPSARSFPTSPAPTEGWIPVPRLSVVSRLGAGVRKASYQRPGFFPTYGGVWPRALLPPCAPARIQTWDLSIPVSPPQPARVEVATVRTECSIAELQGLGGACRVPAQHPAACDAVGGVLLVVPDAPRGSRELTKALEPCCLPGSR
jgi:hypothetical protein